MLVKFGRSRERTAHVPKPCSHGDDRVQKHTSAFWMQWSVECVPPFSPRDQLITYYIYHVYLARCVGTSTVPDGNPIGISLVGSHRQSCEDEGWSVASILPGGNCSSGRNAFWPSRGRQLRRVRDKCARHSLEGVAIAGAEDRRAPFGRDSFGYRRELLATWYGCLLEKGRRRSWHLRGTLNLCVFIRFVKFTCLSI